jgi:hypothetical protein
VVTLALIYRVEGDQRLRDRCWADLDAAAHFPDWGESLNFLATAEMTTAFALAYDWLYDSWSVEQRDILRQAIVDHGLKPGIQVYRTDPQGWPSRTNNWNVVCNGGLGMGALAVADDCPEVAGEVLARGLALVPSCLRQFAPDGAWYEGPMYWGFGTLYESMYLGSLETACGTDFGLGDLPGLSRQGWFPIYMNGATGSPFNFADAEEAEEPRAGPQLLWMARRFKEPRYAQYQIDHRGGRLAALDLIWGPGIAHEAWESIDRDRYFRGVEVATMRDGWNRPGGWFVGLKAGFNERSHAHLDLGSLVLEAAGVRWAVDLGPDDYNLPGYNYHSQPNHRWTYYRTRAEGHNTLVINPAQGPDQSLSGTAKIVDFRSCDQRGELTADLTEAYPDARRVTRSLSFQRGKSLILSDALALKKPGEVWWFLHTRAHIRSGSGGRTLTLSQRGKTMSLRLLAPSPATFEWGPAQPLPGSPHPPGQAANQGVTRVAIHLRDVRDTVIRVAFEAEPDPKVKKLATLPCYAGRVVPEK